MPLHKGAKPGSKGFGENIAAEIRAGKPAKQAEAIAYATAKDKKVRVVKAKDGLHIFLNRATVPARVKVKDAALPRGFDVVQDKYGNWRAYDDGDQEIGVYKTRAQAEKAAHQWYKIQQELIKSEKTKDMKPEEFASLRGLLSKFLSEEASEPEHKAKDCGCSH